MSRLADAIEKIVAAAPTVGAARVDAHTRPGEVRLRGHEDAALVAGNAMPAIGERAPFVRLGDDRLVTPRNARYRMPWVAPAAGRVWQQTLVTDLATYGHDVYKVFHIWQDGAGYWWVSAEKDPAGIYDNPEPILFRGQFGQTPWEYKGAVPGARRGYVIGHGDKIFAVYRTTSAYFPVVRSRQGTIAGDGGITWGDEWDLDHAPWNTELRYPHMMRDPAGYIWLYNAPRAGYPFDRVIWRSNDPDSLANGWQLRHQSTVVDNRPTGFLASNGNRCVLLRMRQMGFPELSCYMETSADWAATPQDLGFPGLMFRHAWWGGKWWLTYGAPGSVAYLNYGLLYIEGGDGDTPSWGAAHYIEPAGTRFYFVLPYGSGNRISAVYAAANELWQAELPSLKQASRFPRDYDGNFLPAGTEVYPLSVEPRGVADADNPVVMWEGHRVWAARWVNA
jgi:hypothetical protein